MAMTYGDVLDRLVELGVAPAERPAELAEWLLKAEVEEVDGEVFHDLGLAVHVHAEDVDRAGPAYEDILAQAATVSGGSIVITDVAFDWAAEHQLTFKVNGHELSWYLDADGPDDDYLNLMAVWEQIGDLTRYADDPRLFYHIPKDQPGDDYYLLLTEEQAEAVRTEYGLELDDM